MNKFGKNLESPDEFILLYNEGPQGIDILCINDYEEWGDVTIINPSVNKADDEIILHHDFVSASRSKGWKKSMLEDLIDYIGVSSRKVHFGPFNAETYVVKLKPDWRELCIPQEKIYGE